MTKKKLVKCKICSVKMKRHMVRHFKTKHRTLYIKLQPLIQKKQRVPQVKTSSYWVKKYRTEVGENKYRCDICQNIFKMPRAHGNMKRHIRLKHPEIYEMEMQLMQINSEEMDEHKSAEIESPPGDEEVVIIEEEEFLEECDEEIEFNQSESKNMPEIESNASLMPEEILYQDVNNLDTEPDTSEFGDVEYSNEKYSENIRGKSLPGMTSNCYWIKKYRTVVDENTYRCDICDSILKICKTQENIKRHFQIQHPKIYEMEMQLLQSNSKQSDEGKNARTESPLEAEEEILIQDEEFLEECVEENEHNPRECKDMPEIESNVSPIAEDTFYQDVDKLDTEPETNDFGDIEYLNERDPAYESKIKWLAQRIVPGKRKIKTCIWNFFNVAKDNHVYSCIFCQKEISIFPYSSSNLKRHITVKHKKEFKVIVKHAPEFKVKYNQLNLNKLLGSGKPADDVTKRFETSYFESLGDYKFKCKSCEVIIESKKSDSLVLFKHIHEKHGDDVISHIKDSVEDDEEFSVLFLKKKDI